MRRTRRRRKQLGFTLAELMFSAFFFTLIIGGLCWGMILISRVAAQESTSSSFTAQSRNALDSMRQDAISSDQVLSTLTVSGVTYTSSPNGVLILEEPTITYDGTGNVSTTYLDHVIYHLVGTSAPYTLKRLVAPQTGSPRPSQPDTVIANNVQSLSITFLHHIVWTGNGTGITFALDVPAASSATAANSIALLSGTTIAIGVSTLFVSPSVTYANGAVTFTTIPANGATIDSFYPVDSTTAVGAAAVSSLNFDLSLSAPTVVSGASSTQAMELVSTAKLRNH